MTGPVVLVGCGRMGRALNRSACKPAVQERAVVVEPQPGQLVAVRRADWSDAEAADLLSAMA